MHLLHAAGSDFPDLAVGFRGVTYLMEVVGEEKLKRFRKTMACLTVKWNGIVRGEGSHVTSRVLKKP